MLDQGQFGIRNFHLKSDTFTWNKEWVIDVCKEITGRSLGAQWLCNSRVDTLDRERLATVLARLPNGTLLAA